LVCFQLSIYKHIRALFPERPWLDVVSKADLLEESPVEIPAEEAESYMLVGPAGALRVSVETEQGLDEVLSQPNRKLDSPLQLVTMRFIPRPHQPSSAKSLTGVLRPLDTLLINPCILAPKNLNMGHFILSDFFTAPIILHPPI